MKLPEVTASPSLVSVGGIGFVYKVNAFIAVKVPRDSDEPDHATEQGVYDTLERHPPHSNILRSFLRVPDATFMEYLPGDNLSSLLWAQQTRDAHTQHVLAVAKLQPARLCLYWLNELTSAIGWLEETGLAHGDIRPPNILLDSRQPIKVGDFDRTIKLGERLDAGTEPFARLMGSEDGDGQDRGTYGAAGPRTEQFAIRSVIFCLTRGHAPYEVAWFGKEHDVILIDMFQKRDFPPLSISNDLDAIIRRCWCGEFNTVKQLSQVLSDLAGRLDEKIGVESTEWFMNRREECPRWSLVDC